MSVLELAKQYYPRLWDEQRILALQEAGKLSPEEVREVSSLLSWALRM